MDKTGKKSKTATATLAPNSTNGNIRQTYDESIIRRAEKYRKDKGLLGIQDVARLAMSFFLDKQGY